MTGTLMILAIAGHIVLLLWGTRMVQSGVERAFGSDLRRVLVRTLRNRVVAAAAGAGVTALLQSSTATAMMVTSFAIRGAVDLVPALAIMLGANVGTALIVKVLSFDVSWLSPLLLLAGYGAFKRSPKGRYRDLGRVGIGLGLMLLALHLVVETVAPLGAAPVLKQILASLTADPILDVGIAALLTFAAHSSVAIILLLVGLSTSDAMTPMAAMALVLGANLGSALPPVLETSAVDPSNRRVPVGNLIFRTLGCAAVLPVIRPLSAEIWRFSPDGAWGITTFHLGFNLVLALVFIGLLGPVGAVLTRWFPEKAKPEDAEPIRSLLIDPEVLNTPYLALANAAREILHMGDLVDALLRVVPRLFDGLDKTAADEARRWGRELDRLHDAVKTYLASLELAGLTDRDLARLSDLIEFAVNLGHAGDILERRIAQASTRQDRVQSETDRSALLDIHRQVVANLQLALSTMMTEDIRSARELIAAKRHLNTLERTASRDHLGRLKGNDPLEAAASSVFLAMLRDIKTVDSYFASIGYAIKDAPIRPAGWPTASAEAEVLPG